VTVIGMLWVTVPEVALIVTCTVCGMPMGVVPAGEFEELQPLTPKAKLVNPTNRKARNSSERLRIPANVRNARGPRKANVMAGCARDSWPVEYGFGEVDATSAIDTLTL